METVRYAVGVLLVAFLPPALLWWFFVHPFVGFWRRVGVRTTLTLMTVLALAGAGALYVVRDLLLGADLGTNWPLFGIGVLLTVLAGVIGYKRKRQLTFRILSGVPELESDPELQGSLLTEGPYAHIRHPRYVEVTLGVFGYAFVANHVGAYVLALAMLPVLHGIVLLEERELLGRFGAEYEEYRSRVPRYLPRLR
jgi:protein-S-isoprenylcysteine O-methyltransferase Ste14